MCDGATREEVRLDLHRTIQRCGWAIQCVEADRRKASWAYTIGLTAAVGHPELVVIGLEPTRAAGGIDVLARRILAGERFTPGCHGLEVAGVHVHLVKVHPNHLRSGLFAAWIDYYAHFGPPPPRFEVHQVVVPTPLPGPGTVTEQLHLDRPETCLSVSQPNRAERRAARHRK